MNVSLPQTWEQFVAGQVSAGEFGNASEVVREIEALLHIRQAVEVGVGSEFFEPQRLSAVAALAALAGVIGGNAFVTEPAMAATVGSIIFVVVVVGGMGSLSGAFLASVLIGVIQTFAVAIDYSFLVLAKDMGWALSAATQENTFAKLTVSQVAPILPYLFLVLILIFRPKGLLGTREG